MGLVAWSMIQTEAGLDEESLSRRGCRVPCRHVPYLDPQSRWSCASSHHIQEQIACPPVLIGYLTAHTMRSNSNAPVLMSSLLTKCSLHTRRPSVIMQHLNIHPTATSEYKRKQPRAAKLEIRIRPIFEIGQRHRFEDPRLARPDDPSSGSTRPAAWDKDMSVPGRRRARDRGLLR